MPSVLINRKLKKSNLDPVTRVYRNNINQSGGSISNSSLASVDTFVKGCKSEGIWDLLVDVGIFAGNDLASALVRLKSLPGKSPSYVSANYVNGDYSESTGILGGTNKFLNTEITLSEIQNTGGISVYLRESVAGGASKVFMGADGASSWLIGYLNSGTGNSFRWGQISSEAVVTEASSAGLFTGFRASATSNNLYRNNSLKVTSSVSDTTVPSGSTAFYIGARNINGTADLFLDRRYSFACIHLFTNASQVSSLYSQVQLLQSSLGRQV